MSNTEENNEDTRAMKDDEKGSNSDLPEPAAEESKATVDSKTKSDETVAEASAPESATTEEVRGKRERKSIQNFNPKEYDKQKKEIVISMGRGVKLMDMPNVVENLKAITWSDTHLKLLHSLIFGGRGKKKEFKAHLLQFNGIVYPEGNDLEEERMKLRQKLYKLTLPGLMSVMDLVDVPRSGSSFGLEKTKVPSKEDYCTRLLEWLEEPKVSGNKRKEPSLSSKKRKSPGSSTTSASAKKSSTEKKKSTSTRKKKVASAAASSPWPKAARALSVAKVEKMMSSEMSEDDEGEVNINIPGVDVDKLREKVRSIVKTGNRDTLSVKSVRAMLEEWLDTDLEKYRDAIRTIVMEEL